MKENGIKLDLLEQILTEPCERKVVEICMDAFKDLIPGDYYSVLYCNLATREIDSFQNGTGWLGTTHPLMKTVREKFTQHPLTRNFLTHRQSGAYVRSDLVSDHLWKRSEIYHEVDRPMGIEDMATIYQVTGSGHLMIMYCGRSRSFRASERLPLSQFQRVLNALPKFRLATTGVSRHLNANSGHPHSDLTVREREVLHWIRQGKRNAEIAVILNISPHTVRHHLENIFRKIGAETRTAAVHAFEF